MSPPRNVTIQRYLSTPVVDGSGVLNDNGVETFMKNVDLEGCGLSYAVLSILGPQSSGKSTILNHAFGTNFQVMNAAEGSSQTTKGIWMAKAVDAKPLTLIIDVEGTDGSERAEQDQTAFEKHSALFALAVSDIVLINMWQHEVGRENAANKPLLRIVFQVMMRLFSLRKRTLLFVVRDYDSETPEEKLETKLKDEVNKIWDKLPKPQQHKLTPLSCFFNVEIALLPHYKHERKQFIHKVEKLRERIGGLVGERTDVVPASAFSSSAKKIWELIKANKDLDLPNINVLIAKERCERIMLERLSNFAENEGWLRTKKAMQSSMWIPDFSKKLNSALAKCLQGYDDEAMYYDKGVRSGHRRQLEERLHHLIQPIFNLALGHIKSETLTEFKEAFRVDDGKMLFSVATHHTRLYMEKFERECKAHAIEQIELDISEVRAHLQRDFQAFIAQVRTDQLDNVTRKFQDNLTRELSGAVEKLMNESNDKTWPQIRSLHQKVTQEADHDLNRLLSGFNVNEGDKEKIRATLRGHSKGLVEKKVREATHSVVLRMKDRFSRLFSYRETDTKLRNWSTTNNKNVEEIKHRAYSEALRVLCVAVAICLDDNQRPADIIIWDTLSVTFLDWEVTSSTQPLASGTWQGLPPKTTVFFTLQECKQLWNDFLTKINNDEVKRAQKKRNTTRRRRMVACAAATVAASATTVAAGVVGLLPIAIAVAPTILTSGAGLIGFSRQSKNDLKINPPSSDADADADADADSDSDSDSDPAE